MVRMAALIDRAALDSATAQGTLGEDGRSGAALERMTLADGRPVVVKRYDPAADLVMRMIGDDHGREVEIFLSGVLDDLPPTVRHPILGAWYDDEGAAWSSCATSATPYSPGTTCSPRRRSGSCCRAWPTSTRRTGAGRR